MNNISKTHEIVILKKYDITLLELDILASIYLEAPIPKHMLAPFTKNRTEGLYRNFNTKQYQKSIDLCLVNDWLKILTKDDCDNDKQRWINDDNQCCEESEYFVDGIDFTNNGADFYYKVTDEFLKYYGEKRYSGIVFYKRKINGRLSIFTTSRADMTDRLKEIKNDSSCILQDNENIIHINNPCEIKNWWITRFDNISSGWRVDIDLY